MNYKGFKYSELGEGRIGAMGRTFGSGDEFRMSVHRALVNVFPISPSNVLCHLGSYFTGPDEWFLRYKLKKPRDPQSQAMMAGSAFDSYVKGALSRIYFGNDTTEELLAESCEDIDFGRRVGLELLRAYSTGGAFGRLRKLLDQADQIILDGKLEGVSPSGVAVMGYQDCAWYSQRSAEEIDRLCQALGCSSVASQHLHVFDWKVTGYMSKASPKPFYCWSSKTGLPYKKGSEWNDKHRDWNLQTTMYAWMLSDSRRESEEKQCSGNCQCKDGVQTHGECSGNCSVVPASPEQYTKMIHQISKSGKGDLITTEYVTESDAQHDEWVDAMVTDVRDRMIAPDTNHEAALRAGYDPALYAMM